MESKYFAVTYFIYGCNTTLSGIAVLNAEEQKTEEFKEATGTSFSVERNYESGGMETDEKGNTYLTSDAITDDMIEKIATNTGQKAR